MNRPALVFLLLLPCAAVADAQVGGAPQLPDATAATQPGISTVQGQIRFADGKPAPSVQVSLTAADSGQVRQAETDSSGNFYFLNLPSGDYRYDVGVSVTGYMQVREPVISCDMAPVSLFITLVPAAGGAGSQKGGTVPASDPAIPKQARALYARGMSAMSKGKPAEASAYFSQAVGVCPVYFDSYLKSAEAYSDERDFGAAQKMIDHAMRLNPNSSAAYAQLGYLRMQEADLAQAKQQFSRAIALNSSQWLAQLELGRILMSENQPDAAYPHLAMAHALRPDLASTHLLLYDDLILLNRKKEALAELDEFLAHFPKAPQAAKLRQMRGALESAVNPSH